MNLVEKIEAKKAQIGIIGLGYVGLPLVAEFARAGFSVTGFDVDSEKIRLLTSGKSYIAHIDTSPLGVSSFAPTDDFAKLADMDCIIICVPTPLDRYREPDMTFVFNTAKTITRYLKKGQLVILESTTYPGTTDEDVRMILEDSGLKAGKDFYLAFSPERQDPANKDFTLRTVPKIVGGYSAECLACSRALYNAIVVKTVPVSSTKVAEAAKLLENIYRSVNIALVNELKVLFDRMDIDIWEVIEAAKTKPFGFQAFYPGPGLGGHCIPIDPFYLTWKAREYRCVTKFIELAGEINTAMPDYVVIKVMEALNDYGKSLRGARVLMLGIAYKGNIDDDRESPAYFLMDKMEDMGAFVSYNDPFIPVIKPTRKFRKFAGRKSVTISRDYDIILIVTPHDEYRKIDFTAFGIPVVDTRNIVPGGARGKGNIYRA